GRGCVVWDGEVLRKIRQQSDSRERLDREVSARPARIKAGRGDAIGSQSFADEKHDPERFLHDPMAEIENPEGDENCQTEQREDLVAPFHSVERAKGAGIVNPATVGN